MERRRSVAENVAALVNKYPDSRFIVTSRIAGYDEAPFPEPTFARCIVQPMEDDGIDAFISWQFSDDLELAHNVHDVLYSNPGVKTLVSNPLLMAILNLVHQKGGEDLPLNRAEFYRRAVVKLIEDEDDRGKRIDPDGHKVHQQILADVACFLHVENRPDISRGELKERVFDFLLEYRGKSDAPTRSEKTKVFEEAEAFIRRAERRTGLLAEKELSSGVFEFAHSTFREYLTAEDIGDRQPPLSP